MSVWLTLLSAYNLQSMTPFFASILLSRLIYIARCVFGSLNVSPGETKFEIFPRTTLGPAV